MSSPLLRRCKLREMQPAIRGWDRWLVPVLRLCRRPRPCKAGAIRQERGEETGRMLRVRKWYHPPRRFKVQAALVGVQDPLEECEIALGRVDARARCRETAPKSFPLRHP